MERARASVRTTILRPKLKLKEVMARIRRDGTTKVWHNPEISGRRSGHAAAPRTAPTLEEKRTANAHRAALEALFSPKKEEDAGKVAKTIEAVTGKAGRIVLAPPPQ